MCVWVWSMGSWTQFFFMNFKTIDFAGEKLISCHDRLLNWLLMTEQLFDAVIKDGDLSFRKLRHLFPLPLRPDCFWWWKRAEPRRNSCKLRRNSCPDMASTFSRKEMQLRRAKSGLIRGWSLLFESGCTSFMPQEMKGFLPALLGRFSTLSFPCTSQPHHSLVLWCCRFYARPLRANVALQRVPRYTKA